MKSIDVCSDDKGSETCMDWTRIMKFATIFSAIDLSIQSQFLQEWAGIYLNGEDFSSNQDNYTDNRSHQSLLISSFTGNHFFYSAVFRLLFVTYFCHICYRKSISRKIQPFMAYVLSAILYLMCVHAVSTFLINSEYSDRFTTAYVTSWLFNLSSTVISGIIVYHVLHNSGAIQTDGEETKDEDTDEEKKDHWDLWSGKRKMPLLTMLQKIFVWYKPQTRWILLSYVLLAVRMSSKF